MNVDSLKQYKDNLYSSFSRDLSEFEKNFLLISNGLLAFTISFIKDIVKIENAHSLYLLLLSWILIIISIALMMYTFLKSSSDSDSLWKIVDDFLIKESLYDDGQTLSTIQAKEIKTAINSYFYECKRKLKNLRYKAIFSFLIGLLLLIVFVWTNLDFQNQNARPSSNTILNEKNKCQIYNH